MKILTIEITKDRDWHPGDEPRRCSACGILVVPTAVSREKCLEVPRHVISIASYKDGADEGSTLSVSEWFCPKCRSDEQVSDYLLVHWCRRCFHSTYELDKLLGDLKYEFVHSHRHETPKPEPPKPETPKKTRVYEVGIIEQHVSWRRVEVPEDADREAILTAAYGSEEFKLEYDGLVEDAKEEITEVTPGSPDEIDEFVKMIK